MNTLIQERHNHSEICITVKVSRRTQKIEILLANEGSGLAFFSTDLRHLFGSNIGNEFGVMLKREGPHKPEFAYDIVRIHSHDIDEPDSVQYRWRHESSNAALLSFCFKAHGWRYHNYWTSYELSDI